MGGAGGGSGAGVSTKGVGGSKGAAGSVSGVIWLGKASNVPSSAITIVGICCTAGLANES